MIPDDSPVWSAPPSDEDCRLLWLAVLARAVCDARGEVICREWRKDEQGEARAFLLSDSGKVACDLAGVDYRAALKAAGI